MTSVNFNHIPGEKYLVGMGYIAIPTDLDRDVYIRDCYKNLHVSIKCEDGCFMNRVPISPDALNFISFPSTVDELGSPVIYNTDERTHQTYIVNRFLSRDEIGDLREHTFAFRRKVDSKFVEISGSPKQNVMNFIVAADKEAAKMNIKLYGNDESQLNVDVAGDIKVVAGGNTSILQHGQFDLSTTDQKGNTAKFTQSTSENKFTNDKFIINKGEQPMMLGTEFVQVMTEFITTCTTIRTVDQTPLDPLVIAKLLKTIPKLQNVLSKVGYLE